MSTTHFIDKETIIEAKWLNDVDATVYQALQGATNAQTGRAALDVPQETQEVAPQVRVNGAWQALSASTAPVHAARHAAGGADPLDHDTLANVITSKHVDHSQVSILAGSGMLGGGTIESTQTLSFSYVLGQNLDANSKRIMNVAAPSAIGDAVNKAYADNLVIEGGANPWFGGVTPNSIYYATGFVGIGTDTPIYDLDVRGDSQVTGDALFGDNVAVSGETNTGTLLVNGQATMGGITSTGINCSGGVTLQSTLNVSGVATLSTLSVSGTLGVSGAATLSSINVSGAATLPTITGPTVLNGDLTLQ
jgi:hypothetical protein